MSGWVAGAIVVSGAIGATTSYLANKDVAEATEEATEATAKATADTNAMLQAQYEQTREDQEPWRLAGEQALQEIQATPDFQFQTEEFDFFTDPSYEFRKKEGIKALDRSGASRGRVLSGAQDRAVTRYASDLASQEYGNAFSRYQSEQAQDYNIQKGVFDTNLNTRKSLAGVGQSATNLLASAGQTTATNIASNTLAGTSQENALLMNQANTTADMYSNLATGANQMMGNYLLYQQQK